jgi:hypothetical protein
MLPCMVRAKMHAAMLAHGSCMAAPRHTPHCTAPCCAVHHAPRHTRPVTRVLAHPAEPHPRNTRMHPQPPDPLDAPSSPNYRRSQGGAHNRRKREGSSSRYVGVSWKKADSSWEVQLYDPQTKRQRRIGSYASEDDAARAYDCAAVQARGPGAQRNFPGEDISELPATVGEERKQRISSHYVGVSWCKASSSWIVRLWDPQTKRQRHIGRYASEEDAARAYDCAAVQARGPGVERNFPGETISELPVSRGDERILKVLHERARRTPGRE